MYKQDKSEKASQITKFIECIKSNHILIQITD